MGQAPPVGCPDHPSGGSSVQSRLGLAASKMMSAHYRQIQEAVAGELKYEYYQDARLQFGETVAVGPESALFPEGVQKMPEVYWPYRKSRTWTSLWWPGGVASQPRILMNE